MFSSCSYPSMWTLRKLENNLCDFLKYQKHWLFLKNQILKFIFRICWDCVSRNAARTTRPLLRPTSCMLSDNTLGFYARIGNSSKLLSTNYSSSCTKLTTEFRTGLTFFFIILNSNAGGWSQWRRPFNRFCLKFSLNWLHIFSLFFSIWFLNIKIFLFGFRTKISS